MTDLSFNTLTEALDTRARETGWLTFIDGQDDERRLDFAQLRDRALLLLGGLRAHGLGAGDSVILYLDDNARFLECFWAAMYGRMLPVPVATGASAAHRDKCLRVWQQLHEPMIVSDARNLQRLQEFADPAVAQRLAQRFIHDPDATVEAGEPCAPAPQDTAFIQFSSGSTGNPKGVVLTHANIMANVRAISQASAYGADEVALSWMPLTHDMGLIGFHLTMLANGFTHHIMRTDLFARRPLHWLQKAAQVRASLLCSPNFGYRHTLRAIAAKGLSDINLSAVRLIYNGAEPIAPALAREFVATLADTGLRPRTMFPVYGLAEASLAVAFPPPARELSSVHVQQTRLGVADAVRLAEPGASGTTELVCLGTAIPGCELRIADRSDQPCASDVVGHVQIRGANVTAGYWENAEANAVALRRDGWLDTGDLGFTHAGELVITGRAREIIFVNGQNIYPQDIEQAALAVDGVDLNRVVATGVRMPQADADTLVLFLLFRGGVAEFVPIARAVAAVINEYTGLVVDQVLPVTRIPKTTSGKLRRGELARAYAAGEFDALQDELARLLPVPFQTRAETQAKPADDDIAATLLRICTAVVPDKTLGRDDNLFEIGLSSLDLAQIHEGIEAEWADRVEITDLFDYPTIGELAQLLATEQQDNNP